MIHIDVINQSDIAKLKHNNYSFLEWCDAHNIDYTQSDSPDWAVMHVIFGSYLMHHRTVQTKAKNLLVWYPAECEHYHSISVEDQIMQMENIDQFTNIVLVTGNLKPTGTRITKIPLLFFDWQLMSYLGQDEDLITEHHYNWSKSKDYMCLNGKDKVSRRRVLDQLQATNLMDHGHVSYVCYDGIDQSLGMIDPIVLDQTRNNILVDDRWMNIKVYNDAWINVVTEAFPFVEQDLFITEKTFKPMLQLQPFMIQGNRHTLARLRDYGYHTFSSLWDESYDDLPQWQDRTDAMLEQLKLWCDKPQHVKQESIRSVWSSLLHNQKMVHDSVCDTRSNAVLEILRGVQATTHTKVYKI